MITGLLGIIFLGFLYETLRIGPSDHGSLDGLVPGVPGPDRFTSRSGLSITVMPHVIYLQPR